MFASSTLMFLASGLVSLTSASPAGGLNTRSIALGKCDLVRDIQDPVHLGSTLKVELFGGNRNTCTYKVVGGYKGAEYLAEAKRDGGRFTKEDQTHAQSHGWEFTYGTGSQDMFLLSPAPWFRSIDATKNWRQAVNAGVLYPSQPKDTQISNCVKFMTSVYNDVIDIFPSLLFDLGFPATLKPKFILSVVDFDNIIYTDNMETMAWFEKREEANWKPYEGDGTAKGQFNRDFMLHVLSKHSSFPLFDTANADGVCFSVRRQISATCAEECN